MPVDPLFPFLSCMSFSTLYCYAYVCVCVYERVYMWPPPGLSVLYLFACTPSSSPRPIHTPQEHVTAWVYPPRPIRVLHPKGNTGCDNRVSCRSCKKSAACSLLPDLVYWCTLAELGSISLNTSTRIWWVGLLCMQKAERALWAINRGLFFLNVL